MEKFTSKEQEELILRGLFKDQKLTKPELACRDKLIQENPGIEDRYKEMFGATFVFAMDKTKGIRAEADRLIALANDDINTFLKCPPVKASVTAMLIAKSQAKGKKFSRGRTPGSVEKHTAYMIELRKKHPNKTAEELFNIALDEANSESSPFCKNTKGELLVRYKNQTEMTKENFANKISDIRTHGKR